MSSSPQRFAQASTQTPSAPTPTNLNRRRFLTALGVGGAGAAVAVAQPVAATVAGPAVAPAESEQGYRETEHIRDYYATTRI